MSFLRRDVQISSPHQAIGMTVGNWNAAMEFVEIDHKTSFGVALVGPEEQNVAMEVILNGERKDVAQNTTLSTLVESLGLDLRRIAIELNEQVIPRTQHAATVLAAGDRIEIVTFVGGG